MTGVQNYNELEYNILWLLFNREDLTCYAISKRLKCSQSLVYKINSKYNIRDLTPTTKRYAETRPEVEDKVKDYLIHSDLSMVAIGKIFGVSNSYVKTVNDKYDIRSNY